MANGIDPNILLGIQPRDTIGALRGGAQGALQGIGQISQLQSGIASREAEAATAQELAEATEFKRLSPLFDLKNPKAFVDAAQQSNVFDAEDKAEIQQFIQNPELFTSAQQLSDGLLGITPGTPQVLGEGDVLVDPSTGREIAQGPVGPAPQIPVQLLSGLSPELADKGSAAFSAAGGGKDGIKAFTSIVDKGTEQERRATSPQLLQANFPNASPAETTQLQGAMDAAKTTSEGLKAAAKVRDEQRRLKKAQGFQQRAVSLLESVLTNPELVDVIGSIEGAIDFRFQDSESELIADITEAGDILTAENMDLMTGVLSESDIKLLRNLAGGGLSRKRSEKRFRSDAQRIIDTLSKVPVSTVDDRGGGNVFQFDAQGNLIQ